MMIAYYRVNETERVILHLVMIIACTQKEHVLL